MYQYYLDTFVCGNLSEVRARGKRFLICCAAIRLKIGKNSKSVAVKCGPVLTVFISISKALVDLSFFLEEYYHSEV